MSIAPINKSVRVQADPARAFDLFVNHMAQWWPKGIGKNSHAAIVVEPRAEGRWFERDPEGNETPRALANAGVDCADLSHSESRFVARADERAREPATDHLGSCRRARRSGLTWPGSG